MNKISKEALKLKRIWTYEPNSNILDTLFKAMKITIIAGLILSAALYVISLKEISPYSYKQIEEYQKASDINSEDKQKLDELTKNSLENDGVITRAEKSKIDNLYEDYRMHRLRENLLK